MYTAPQPASCKAIVWPCNLDRRSHHDIHGYRASAARSAQAAVNARLESRHRALQRTAARSATGLEYYLLDVPFSHRETLW